MGRPASSSPATGHPALPAAVEMGVAPGAEPGSLWARPEPSAGAGRPGQPPGNELGGSRSQRTTHSVSRLEVPLRSGNSCMSVAPFRDLEAEPAARRRGQHASTSSSRPSGSPCTRPRPSPPRSPWLPGSGGGRAWQHRVLAAAALGPRVPATQAGSRASPLLKGNGSAPGASEGPRAAGRRAAACRASSGRPPCSSLLGCLRRVASRTPHPPVSTRTPRTRTWQGHRKRAADPSGQRGVQKRGPMGGQGPGSEPGQDLGAQDPSIKCTESPSGVGRRRDRTRSTKARRAR